MYCASDDECKARGLEVSRIKTGLGIGTKAHQDRRRGDALDLGMVPATQPRRGQQ